MSEAHETESRPEDRWRLLARFRVALGAPTGALWLTYYAAVAVVTLLVVPGLWRFLGAVGVGSLGDFFGLASALFSGWAFIAFLQALQLQRQELNQTRLELRRSADAQQAQVEEYEKSRRHEMERELVAITPRLEIDGAATYVDAQRAWRVPVRNVGHDLLRVVVGSRQTGLPLPTESSWHNWPAQRVRCFMVNALKTDFTPLMEWTVRYTANSGWIALADITIDEGDNFVAVDCARWENTSWRWARKRTYRKALLLGKQLNELSTQQRRSLDQVLRSIGDPATGRLQPERGQSEKEFREYDSVIILAGEHPGKNMLADERFLLRALKHHLPVWSVSTVGVVHFKQIPNWRVPED